MRMMINGWSDIWASIAPAIARHLWQSTEFAIAVGLLTLVLRNNSARTRYWLWLAASSKFLIPFSFLVSIGNRLAWRRGTSQANAGLHFTMEKLGQVFSSPTIISQTASPIVSRDPVHLTPILLTAIWLCGLLVVLGTWGLRWRKISVVKNGAAPLRDGREVEILRRVEAAAGVEHRIEILLSQTSLEPGVVGILRPVLIWPKGISEHLEDGHLNAILTHEVWHVRRRDNLAAAIHMVVEFVFWFHPLVWWLGSRLVEDRERACDEAVLGLGHQRHIYAESILKVCQFCVESQLACVSGVTGADLKKRIAQVMTRPINQKLDLCRRIILATAGLMIISLPLAYGLTHAGENWIDPSKNQSLEPPDWQKDAGGKQSFEIASVKQNKSGSEVTRMSVPIAPGDIYPPNGGLFSGTNVPLISYIYFAYKLSGTQFQFLLPQLSQLSPWVKEDRFDIQARADGNPTKDQMRLMVQSLLADRFKLTIHYETRQLPVFALVLTKPGKTGPQLQPHAEDTPCVAPPPSKISGPAPTPPTLPGGLPVACGGIVGLPASNTGRLRVGARGIPIGLLASTMAQIGNLDRPVVDRTGLNGTFDFSFEWTTERNGPGSLGPDAQLDESGPTFIEDLKKQLGLQLESQKGDAEIFVIDHIERPSEN